MQPVGRTMFVQPSSEAKRRAWESIRMVGMLSKLRVRTKLIVVLIVPLLALAVLTGVYVKERFDRRNDALADVSLARATRLIGAANSETGIERLLSIGVMGGETEALSEELDDQRQRTDQTLGAATTAIAELNLVSSDKNAAKDLQKLRSEAADLDSLRKKVSGEGAEILDVAAGYDQVTDRLDSLVARLADTSNGGAALNDLSILVKADSTESKQVTYVAAQLAASKAIGTADRTKAASIAAEAGDLSSALRTTYVENLAGADDRAIITSAETDQRYSASTAVFGRIEGGKPPAGYDLSLSEFISLTTDRLDVVSETEQQLIAKTEQKSVATADSANGWTRALVALAVAGFVLAAAFAVLVGRSITRPLLKLARSARQMSEETMPALVDSMARPDIAPPAFEPIDIGSNDELGELAGALNDLQKSALEVSQRQGDVLKRGISDIFVNLARRNQSLLDRQIEFIDHLEATEEDPEQLDRLFRLDHLATRMRRNAESLLVLAGAEQTRRRTRDVALADVVRVAIGEVEDYRRITVAALDDVMVSGSVAVDLAHLLSELMENGSQYSPPDSLVEVVGHHTTNGTYALTVTDRGVGMTDAQMGHANSVLARPPAVALNVGRALGFVVVSALAARHKISVRVAKGVSSGTVAAVALPAGSFKYAVAEAPTTATPPAAPYGAAPAAAPFGLAGRSSSAPYSGHATGSRATTNQPTSDQSSGGQSSGGLAGLSGFAAGRAAAAADTSGTYNNAALFGGTTPFEDPADQVPNLGGRGNPFDVAPQLQQGRSAEPYRTDPAEPTHSAGSLAPLPPIPSPSGEAPSAFSNPAPFGFEEPPVQSLPAASHRDLREERSHGSWGNPSWYPGDSAPEAFAAPELPAPHHEELHPQPPEMFNTGRESSYREPSDHPSGFDSAVPLGKAFEMGIYSLLDDHDAATHEPVYEQFPHGQHAEFQRPDHERPDQQHPDPRHPDHRAGDALVGFEAHPDAFAPATDSGEPFDAEDLPGAFLEPLPPVAMPRTESRDAGDLLNAAFAMDALPGAGDNSPRELPRREAQRTAAEDSFAVEPSAGASNRSPEQVWTMLNRYRSARQRGRVGENDVVQSGDSSPSDDGEEGVGANDFYVVDSIEGDGYR